MRASRILVLMLVTVVMAGALAAGLSSCGRGQEEDCLQLPCALPVAVEVSVWAADGRPIMAATVVAGMQGGAQTTVLCTGGTGSNTCAIPGAAGVYGLNVVASGYATGHYVVTVAGTNPECACPTTVPAELRAVLTPDPRGTD